MEGDVLPPPRERVQSSCCVGYDQGPGSGFLALLRATCLPEEEGEPAHPTPVLSTADFPAVMTQSLCKPFPRVGFAVGL